MIFKILELMIYLFLGILNIRCAIFMFNNISDIILSLLAK